MCKIIGSVYTKYYGVCKAQHTLGNIVAGNDVSGNTQCMVMIGPATMLLRIDNGSIRSNIVAGHIMTIHWVFPATLLPATMLPSVCWA